MANLGARKVSNLKGKPFRFWATLASGLILGVTLSCIAAISFTIFHWNRNAIKQDNRIFQAMKSANIESGQAKPLEIEEFSAEMTRSEVSKFMYKNKFRHAGSRVLINNLAELEQPKGYVEIFGAKSGHILCSARYLVITYYDETSHFIKATAAIHQNGCV